MKVETAQIIRRTWLMRYYLPVQNREWFVRIFIWRHITESRWMTLSGHQPSLATIGESRNLRVNWVTNNIDLRGVVVVVAIVVEPGRFYTRRETACALRQRIFFDNEGFPVNCTRMNDVDCEWLSVPFTHRRFSAFIFSIDFQILMAVTFRDDLLLDENA